MRPPTVRRILTAAAISLCFGLGAIVLLDGFSTSYPVRVLQHVAIFVLGAVVIGGGAIWIALKLAGWRDPQSEADFNRVVERSERLAADNLAVEPDEDEFLELDPLDDDDFEELVRDALDELPDWARKALHHVAVVISDDGWRNRAYGLYQGDGVARDDYPDRIIIFRDTLRRDFGDEPDELREQVVITVRHEMAHHLGWDELGVKDLGL